MKIKQNHLDLVFLFVTIPLAYIIYRQGLPGGFILDDTVNLELLSNTSAGFSLQELNIFLTQQGIAGPLGRPISLFTFYLQRDSWPLRPEDFRHIGIIIHLLNANLIYIFIKQLATKFPESNSNSNWISFVVATIWLVHPIHASSALYIIQRMTTLSSSFVLVGCIVYLKYLDTLTNKENIKISIFYLVGVIAAGTLAILSKESGGLLLLYIFCIQLTLPSQTENRINTAVIFCTRTLVFTFFIYLLHSLAFATWPSRDFTPWERVITESRILVEYLYKIIAPTSNSLHLFYDDYNISRSIIDPPSTLLALSCIIAIFLSAVALRKRYSLFSFCILWFLLGHSLESTTLGLELYFDHRNYLPMLGPILLLTAGLNSLTHKTNLNQKLISNIAIVYALLLAAVLLSQAIIWSDPTKQALIWAKSKPYSLRAQEYAAITLANQGYVINAASIVRESANRHKKELSPWLSLARLKCMDDRVTLEDHKPIIENFQKTTHFRYIENSLQELVEAVNSGACSKQVKNLTYQIVDALLNNPAKLEKDRLHFMKATLLHKDGNIKLAITEMERSFKLNSNIEMLIIITNWQQQLGLHTNACDTVRRALPYINLNKHNQIYSYMITSKLNECSRLQ